MRIRMYIRSKGNQSPLKTSIRFVPKIELNLRHQEQFKLN